MRAHIIRCDNCGTETQDPDPMWWSLMSPRVVHYVDDQPVQKTAFDFCSLRCVAKALGGKIVSYMED